MISDYFLRFFALVIPGFFFVFLFHLSIVAVVVAFSFFFCLFILHKSTPIDSYIVRRWILLDLEGLAVYLAYVRLKPLGRFE